MLIDLGEDRQLELFGLWPFGDLERVPKDKPPGPDSRK
jgi:hypothetical protein